MRVVIAEDSGLLRQLLAELLTSRGLTVTGTVGTPADLRAHLVADPPDVVVLDIRMPPTYRDEGLRAAEQIRAEFPSVAILVLSHYAETAYAIRLLEAADRAVGYLVKDRVQDADRLVEAINRIAAGEVVIDPDVVRRVMSRPRAVDPLDRLTVSERDILGLVAEGHSNTAIARKLNYSVKTIEKRVTAVAHKLGLPPADDDRRADLNVRVLAVLSYLRGADRVEESPIGPPDPGAGLE
jgi:DNA-binding NarL/FixJ family response regulator